MDNYLLELYKNQIIEQMSAFTTLEKGLSAANELVEEHGLALNQENIDLLTQWWNEANPTVAITESTEIANEVLTEKTVDASGNTIYNITLPEAPDTSGFDSYTAESILKAWISAIESFSSK